MKYDINLQYTNEGYGIMQFAQIIETDGQPLEFIVKDLKPEQSDRANTLVRQTWDWAGENMGAIKDYLSRELDLKLTGMRQKKARNVPADDLQMIRRQLEEINVSRITFFPNQSSFTMDFFGYFNGYRYRMYVSMKDDFTFKRGDILTMGGFKPPKDEAKPDLSKAPALYEYHLAHGNEKGLYWYYAALSEGEINRFIDLFIADGENDMEDRLDLVLYLALYAHACGDKLPDRLYRYLIDQEVFYYGEIYLRADEWVAVELMELLGEVDDDEAYVLSVDHILCALAMIPCRAINDFFRQSSCDPLPIWAGRLHIRPRDYAMAGGWETTESGLPRILYHQDVTAYEPCPPADSSPEAPLESLAEMCGICGQPLTHIFDCNHPLSTCLYCSCYQTVYTRIRPGGVHWHERNQISEFFQNNPDFMKNEENIAASFKHGLRPSGEVRQAFWTAHQFAEIPRTQTGGMPTAVNDMHYPECPDCGKTMTFAAQLDMGDVQEYGDGLYYFFVCRECGVTAAGYDQT